MHAEKLNPPRNCFIAGELLTCVKLVTSTTYTFGYLTEKVNLSGLPFHQEVEWITCCHVGQVGIKNLGIFFLHPTPFFYTQRFEWKINFTSSSLTLKCQIQINWEIVCLHHSFTRFFISSLKFFHLLLFNLWLSSSIHVCSSAVSVFISLSP